jgi:amino acid transporter
LTPHVSTIVVGALATIWYVPLNFISENFLFDTLSALSLMIAFYYALIGFACAIYYRHDLLKSAKDFVFIGLAPVLGALMLAYLFFRSMVDLANPSARTPAVPSSASGCRSSSGWASSCSVSSWRSCGASAATAAFSDAARRPCPLRLRKAGYACKKPPAPHRKRVRECRASSRPGAVAPFWRCCYTELTSVL